jgi:hypothetical protein
VIAPSGCIQVGAFVGQETTDRKQLLLRIDAEATALSGTQPRGTAPPFEVLLEQGQPLPGSAAILTGISRPLSGADGDFALVTTDAGRTLVRFPSGGQPAPILGAGAAGQRGDLDPQYYVVNGGDVVASALDGDGDPLIVSADLAAPTTTAIAAAGDMFGGGTVTGVFSLDPIFLNAAHAGTARIVVDSTTDVLITFDANSGARTARVTELAPAPGFPAGVNVLGFSSAGSARIDAGGFVAVALRLLGPGVSSANDEVVYLFDPTFAVAAMLREGMQIPDQPPGSVFTLLASPVLGSTGAVVLHRQIRPDMTMPRAIGFVDLQGQYRTIAATGTAAPGGGTFTEFLVEFAMNEAGTLVFRGRLEGGATAYYAVDTGDPGAMPVRLVGAGDDVALPGGGSATIGGVAVIPVTGGQSGDATALNDTHLVVVAGFSNQQSGVLTVELPQ